MSRTAFRGMRWCIALDLILLAAYLTCSGCIFTLNSAAEQLEAE